MTYSASYWSRMSAYRLLRLLPAFKICTPRPFDAITRNKMLIEMSELNLIRSELTADVEGVTEGRGNLRVELNHEILLRRKLIVTILDLLGDPLSQVIAHDRVDYVDDPLPWKLGNVSLVWHVVLHLLVLHAEVEDSFHCETLVAWNMQVLCLVGFDGYRYVSVILLGTYSS